MEFFDSLGKIKIIIILNIVNRNQSITVENDIKYLFLIGILYETKMPNKKSWSSLKTPLQNSIFVVKDHLLYYPLKVKQTHFFINNLYMLYIPFLDINFF